MGLSWSAMRKRLEKENLCDCLKGRVQYFATRYRKAHDETGRVAVRVDGEEVIKSDWFKWTGITYGEKNAAVDLRALDITEPAMWEKVINQTYSEGGFNEHSFYRAFYDYQNHSIEESLPSENPLVRLLAILDKRVGKRTLKELETAIVQQPSWLQVFYKLRLEAEGIK